MFSIAWSNSRNTNQFHRRHHVVHLPQNFNYTAAVMCIYERKHGKLSPNYSNNPTTNMRKNTCCNCATTANVKRIFAASGKNEKKRNTKKKEKKFSIKTLHEFAQFQFLHFAPLHSTCSRAATISHASLKNLKQWKNSLRPCNTMRVRNMAT